MVDTHNALRQAWPFLLFHKQGKQVWRVWGLAHGYTDSRQQRVNSLPKIAPLGLYFKPWCPARHEECTEVNCFYLGTLYSVQEFLQYPPVVKRRGHRSPQGPGHMLTYIHLSFFYLPAVASQSQAPKSGEELHFCSRH